MILLGQALSYLRPNAEWVTVDNTYEGLNWLDTAQTKPTEQEITDAITHLENQAPLDACKNEAKRLIALTDWSVLPDVNISNKVEFELYRSELRDLIINPIVNPVFPTEPQPIWV